MEERRLLVAVALSLLILTGYSLLFGPRSGPPSPEVSPAAPGSPAVAVEPTPASSSSAPEAAKEAPLASVGEEREPEETVAAVPSVMADQETRVEVHGGTETVAFTNRGARLLSWTLTEYLDSRGRPEEMVPSATPGLRPLDFDTGDAAMDDRLREALFVPSTENLVVDGRSPRTLTFRYAEGTLEAEKAFTFGEGGFVGVSMSVTSGGRDYPCRVVWGPGLGNPTEAEREVRGYKEPQGVALVQGDVERVSPEDLGPTGKKLPSVRWVGVESVYFAALMIPPEGLAAAEIRPVTQPVSAEEEPTVAAAAVVDGTGPSPILLFVGAKDHQALQKLGYGLENVVPVGNWIGPIVVPLMRLLRWVHGLVGNWGWAIVILTVMINMVMAPLRHYSIANGMKMAKMQPEMKVIQERYRKVPMMDPRRQKMQEEMGALYAKHGMSMGTQMLVGCLPLLLTMPFLFAFYRVLMISVELRGAPFLWIPDLSQKDPLFLTPVAMGVSMYAMQKMTPSTLDPSQQRIMMLMPVMLAGMFLWAPSGLNLYWLTANLWSLLQQTVEMRILKPKEVAPPPKKKGRKKR
jgi:YidC/Oxa1 family membrane protein insertase